jgi:hypothetical protein
MKNNAFVGAATALAASLLAGCGPQTTNDVATNTLHNALLEGREAAGRNSSGPAAALARARPNQGEKLVNLVVKRGSARRAAVLDTIWEVLALNETNEDFDEVDLSFNRFSNPFAQIFPHTPFPNGDVVFWDIPNCEDINEFAVGLIKNNQLVFSTGDLTRNADDGDVCSDTFDFVP